MEKTALFVGSFDPFTIGHDDIVRRALTLVDRLVIGVGINENKKYTHTTEERIKAITQLYADEPRITVRGYSCLTIDLAREEGAQFVVKGVRSVKDFEYEREQAEINRQLSGLETLLLCADPRLASVSSSLVRELAHYGQDVSMYLPQGKAK